MSATDEASAGETDTERDDGRDLSPVQRFVAAIRPTPDELAADRRQLAQLLRETGG